MIVIYIIFTNSIFVGGCSFVMTTTDFFKPIFIFLYFPCKRRLIDMLNINNTFFDNISMTIKLCC